MELLTKRRRKSLTKHAAVRAEISQKLVILRPLVHAVAAMFGHQLEVVLHDLQNPKHSIVAISNGHVSGRQVGDPIIGGPFNDKGFRLLQEPGQEARALVNYSTKSRDGRQLKSATVVYYSRITGRPIVALCLNLDLTSFQAIHSTLNVLLGGDGRDDLEADGDQRRSRDLDLNAIVEAVIDEAVKNVGKPAALMGRREKTAIVGSLNETGVFLIRGSVHQVARSLGISRFTVYNYLKEYSKGVRSQQDSRGNSQISRSDGHLIRNARSESILTTNEFSGTAKVSRKLGRHAR